MCFLKTLKSLDQMSFDKQALHSSTDLDQSCQSESQKDSFLSELLLSKTPLPFHPNDQYLFQLLNCLESNAKQLQKLKNKISQNEQTISSALNQINVTHQEDAEDIQNSLSEHPIQNLAFLEQIFGKRDYRYRLEIIDFPQAIFKERNISFQVLLIDHKGQRVLNSNIIHLCLGVCDTRGDWVVQNKGGEPFIKGKTEVELYHGNAAFLKIYPRDVSRHYPEGKLNFIIYSKPSMIKFSSVSTTMEQSINSIEIEPLIIRNLQIKAKRKE